MFSFGITNCSRVYRKGEPQVENIFEGVHSTEYSFQWSVYDNYSSQTCSKGHRNKTEEFLIKREDEGNSYEYKWNMNICKDQQQDLNLSVCLESFTDSHSVDKKIFVNLIITSAFSHEDGINYDEKIGHPVDFLNLKKEIIQRKLCISHKYSVNVNIDIKIFWNKNKSIVSQIQNQLSIDFEKLYIEQLLTDVTFVFNNNQKEIKAHKLILIARSLVFNSMFQNQMLESRDNCRIDIKDIDSDTFEKVMYYIYSGKINVTSTNKLVDLMVAADKYALNDLKAYCTTELKKHLNIENASDMLVVSDLVNSDSLKTAAIYFILFEKYEVMKTDGYKKLRKNHSRLITELFEK